MLPDWLEWLRDPVWVTAIATGLLAVFTMVLTAFSAPVLWNWRRESKERKARKTQEEFKSVREYIKRHRCELAQKAFLKAKPQDYPEELQGTSWLSRRPWICEKPIQITSVKQLLQGVPASTDQESAGPFEWPGADQMHDVLKRIGKTLPLDDQGKRFPTLSATVRAVEKPAPNLFANRISYKVRPGNEAAEGMPTEFILGKYFENIDIGEALVYEFARATMYGSSSTPARDSLGQPWDLKFGRLPGICTLTVVATADDGPIVFMHDRRPGDVATAVASYHVAPAGEFQPSSALTTAIDRDFSLWYNAIREYTEEFLGREERRDENALSIDYEQDPDFRPFMKAWKEKKARFYYLGWGLDPLSLKMEILTACVFDEKEFKEIFRKRLEQIFREKGSLRGPEGEILAKISFEAQEGKKGWIQGKPLDEALRDFTAANSLPAAVACLRLFAKAWNSKEVT